MKYHLQILLAFLFCLFTSSVFALPVGAADGQVLGIHIMNVHELDRAITLLKTDENQSEWQYVTVPFTFADLEKREEWERFFANCREHKIIPLVRLGTRFENGAWQIPNQKQITEQINFLAALTWPTDEKHIIFLNETNHAPEFGGNLDPAQYAELLDFASRWAVYSDPRFRVLPGALDLAASTGGSTQEAFHYLDAMIASQPDVFDHIAYWNSHSYPNPAFSAPPTATGKNSLKGFQYELDYLEKKLGKKFTVFITETGWRETAATSRWLESYYTYAQQHIWSDERVVAVTPFVLQGAPGPFTQFSFLNAKNEPTRQYLAYRRLVEATP